MCAKSKGSEDPFEEESKIKAVLMASPFVLMAGLFAAASTEVFAPVNVHSGEPVPVEMSMRNTLTLAFALNAQSFGHGGKTYEHTATKNADGCHEVAAYAQVHDLQQRARRPVLTIKVCDAPKEHLRLEASVITPGP